MKPDDLIAEARAKIIWGDPASSVHDFLTANGISVLDADAAIEQFNAERNTELRTIGIRKIFIGVALTIGAGIFFYLGLKYVDMDKMNGRSASGFAMVALVIAIGGFYGCWKLIDGISYLVRPQSEDKSISEIS